MKAIAMVAHPDDCVLFGYYIMQGLGKHLDWHVCYLTHADADERFTEMKTFWEKRNVTISTLGFQYEWDDVVNNEIKFDTAEAIKKIVEAVSGYDLVFTHNHLGDYGHIHHLFLYNAIKDLPIAKVYTGIYPDLYNINYLYDANPFSSDELPLHKGVIDNWDIKSYKYFVTPEAQELFPDFTPDK
jgi:LmbE family N-acetylglucosaminyl deacetylase